jgi:hypothetical protein
MERKTEKTTTYTSGAPATAAGETYAIKTKQTCCANIYLRLAIWIALPNAGRVAWLPARGIYILGIGRCTQRKHWALALVIGCLVLFEGLRIARACICMV